MQKSKIKMQNVIQNSKLEKDRFKKEFIARLIRFTVDIIRVCRELEKDNIFWSICDQLIRSSASVGANIVEAKSASSKLEYKKFFEIALKSANETIYWLLVIKSVNQNKNLKSEINRLYNEVIEISKIVGPSVLTLKGKKHFEF
jgi:four helix bundle protein